MSVNSMNSIRIQAQILLLHLFLWTEWNTQYGISPSQWQQMAHGAR